MAFLVAGISPAMAQAVPGSADASRVQDQVQRPELENKVQPQINIPEIRVEGAPQGGENIRFTLKTLTLEGVTAYNQEALKSIYAKDIGQTISLARLYEIAGEITRKYRNDGYIITQTVVPPQTIEGGDAKLMIVEGAIDQVIVEGAVNDLDGKQIRILADKLRASAPLSSKELERYLLLINDLPGVSARSIIGPSPTAPGKADMRIIVSRAKANFLVGGDNYGSKYLGPWQVTGAAQFNNMLGFNDRFTAQIVAAPAHNELFYAYGAYSMPIGSEGTTVTADISHSDTEPGYDLRIFGVEGYSTTFGATVEHPLIRSRNENLTLRGRLDSKWSSTKSDLGVTTEDSIRSLRLGARYDKLSNFLGTSVNMVDVQLSKGLDFWHPSQKGDTDLSRADGDPQYLKFEAEITRLQRIVKDFNLLLGVKGQKANNALLSPEEFGIGGMGTGYGRGYDPSEILGDEGIATKVELQWNTHAFDDQIKSLQLFSFYDAGIIWNKDATTSADKRDSIASVGFGVRGRITDTLSADGTVAFPLTKDVATEKNTDPRFFISITNRF